MRKSIYTLLLACALILTLLPVNALAEEPDTWDGSADTTWYNGSEAEFTITSAEELAGLAVLVNNGTNFSKKTIKIQNCTFVECRTTKMSQKHIYMLSNIPATCFCVVMQGMEYPQREKDLKSKTGFLMDGREKALHIRRQGTAFIRITRCKK